jgi:hypothetical protein
VAAVGWTFVEETGNGFADHDLELELDVQYPMATDGSAIAMPTSQPTGPANRAEATLLPDNKIRRRGGRIRV